MSDYVREVLRESWSDAPATSVEAKLAVVREAARHGYPTADPDEMNAQIRAGQQAGLDPEVA